MRKFRRKFEKIYSNFLKNTKEKSKGKLMKNKENLKKIHWQIWSKKYCADIEDARIFFDTLLQNYKHKNSQKKRKKGESVIPFLIMYFIILVAYLKQIFRYKVKIPRENMSISPLRAKR